MSELARARSLTRAQFSDKLLLLRVRGWSATTSRQLAITGRCWEAVFVFIRQPRYRFIARCLEISVFVRPPIGVGENPGS